MKKVKVLLLKDTPGVGKEGEVKEVNRGYAENFLFPRGQARLVDDEVSNLLQAKALKEKIQQEKKQREAEEVKKIIESNTLVIKARAGQEGKIFGSITAKDLAEALLRQLSVKIDKREIKLEENLKKIGKYGYQVKLFGGLKAEGEVLIERDA